MERDVQGFIQSVQDIPEHWSKQENYLETDQELFIVFTWKMGSRQSR